MPTSQRTMSARGPLLTGRGKEEMATSDLPDNKGRGVFGDSQSEGRLRNKRERGFSTVVSNCLGFAIVCFFGGRAIAIKVNQKSNPETRCAQGQTLRNSSTRVIFFVCGVCMHLFFLQHQIAFIFLLQRKHVRANTPPPFF